ILKIIDSSSRPADSLIDTFFRSHKYLGSNDRRFIAEHTYNFLRHFRRLQYIVQRLMHDFDGNVSEEDGMYVMLCVLLLPEYTDQEIVKEALKKKLAGGQLIAFLPKLLPRLKNDIAYPDGFIERLSVQYSYPEWMVRRFIADHGKDEAERLCAGLNTPAPLTLRVNTLKTTVEECRVKLLSAGIETKKTPLSPFGLKVSKRINIFSLDVFRQGWFEVQDEGSQILPLLVDPKPAIKLLDACAGAGGKTLEFSALMKNRGEIVAADVNSYRLEELRKRSKRAGADNIRIRAVESLADLQKEYTEYFDVVFVDAPCSGLGTIRRNPGLKWKVNEQTINEVSEKQQSILMSVSPLLKPGGILVYATCTVLHQENELQIDAFRARTENYSPYLKASASGLCPEMIRQNSAFFSFLPHKHDTDGFFCAMLTKIR
ncbi:MAG: 16S rRNA (cytosine(967)-C(5))-methyltransferase RsmB, partial [Bacteroidota bacterium]